ncbi:DoxX family protein [Mycetocola spongiae]|uniref:DoxX family protein n=1 Tax=Mycetocola spongiae TaxID=2859226 RepID=UPI001CF53CC4|nr:DoxX family protein [Mycetocola spongiae]UCR90043.1 DoxX family protein [Mycetocola spongiae]
MFIALIILNSLLALVFIGSGGMKTFAPIPMLAARGMNFVNHYPAAAVRLIGAAEVLGGLGLLLPLLTGIAPLLTPIAAIGLAIIMAGAIWEHARHRESIVPVLALTVLSAASAVLGFLWIAG